MNRFLLPLTKMLVLLLGIVSTSGAVGTIGNEAAANINSPMLINSIQNPEFDEGTTGWQLGDWTGPGYSNGGSSFSAVTGAGMSGTNALYINVVNTNSGGWTLQPKQILNFDLQVGHTYTISFMAKGETSRVMDAAVRGEGSNTDYWKTLINLTTNVQTFTFEYTCNNAAVNNESDFSIAFYLAKGVISDVWIDKVIVEDITTTTPATAVSVAPESMVLAIGQTGQLTKTVYPVSATNQNVTWTSSNTGVATVSNAGLVTATSAGTATVTATTVDGGFTATSSVTVQAPGVNGVQNPEFDLGTSNWALGDWTGPNYSNGGNTFSAVTGQGMSGANALYVDVVNANNGGWTLQPKQILNFRLQVGRTYSISFMAKGQTNRSMNAALRGEGSNIDYWNTNVNLTTSNQTFTYQYTCNNSNANTESFFSIAFYLAKGVVSDVWIDRVLVEDVTGIVPVTGVSLAPLTLALNTGTTGQLTPTIAPTNATNQDISWSSSNPSVATVNATGLVSAVAVGTATITATTANGSKTATASVTVTSVAVTGVSVSPSNLTLAPLQTEQLTHTVIPSNATNQNVSWSSSNTGIATVDNQGLVTAVSAGSATITVTTAHGGFTDQVNVTVSSVSGDVPDALEIAALKDFYNSTSGPNWINKANWPSSEQEWLNIQRVADIDFYGVGITDGDVTDLTFPFNGLNGSIPSSISNLTKLEGINLSNNRILSVGTLNQISGLKYVYLRQAQLAVLPNFGDSQALIQLDIASNPAIASAPFPSWIQNLHNIEWLSLENLNITGGLPSWLGNLNSLEWLYLGSNQLTGTIPQNLSGLSGLNLSFNNLSGFMPDWIFSEGRVVVILNNNQLTGTLPEISVNTSLIFLNISNNNISGEIPTSINNLTSIVHLNLAHNQLTGAIPASLAALGPVCTTNCGAFINLSHNKLSSIASGFWIQFDYPLTILAEFNELVDIGTIPNNLNLPGFILINYNFLSYNSLETAFNYSSDKIQYVVQRANPNEINGVVGQPLEIIFEQPNAPVEVVWEKDGYNITSLDESADINMFRRNAAALSDAGEYLYKVTSTQNPSIYVVTTSLKINIEETPETRVINDFAFQYKYDARRRMSHKKVPGADWVYMVYDNRDRLVMTQDGNQRDNREWTFTKYDHLNRPVLTGIFKDTAVEPLDQGEMQLAVNNFYAAADAPNNPDDWFEISGSVVHGYTNQSFPKVDVEGDYLSVTYYDDYSFQPSIGSSASDFNYDPNQLTASGNEPGQRSEEFTRVQGQVTGSKIKNLDTNEFLWSVNYYDDRYRVIQVIAQNNKSGLDKITNVYDFVGKVLRTKTDHNVAGTNPMAIATTRKLTYDHAGRLLQTEHQTGTADPVVLSKNGYNELGQLVTKNLHSEDDINFKQQVDYRYNIRGWLTRINDSNLSTTDGGPKDYFGMELGYNSPLGIGAAPQYNGNISAIKWSSNLGLGFNNAALEIFEPTARAYAFSYDALNRLKTSAHFENTVGWNPAASFHEDIDEYDLNGNIKKLHRTGRVGNDMDILDYTYSGNRLMKVADAGNKSEGFKDGNVTGDDYIYDTNGNMVTDKNKNIATIEYNYLNLPAIVTKGDGQYVKYIYNAAGVKMSQEVYDDSDVLKKKTDYMGEFFYANDTLKFVNHEEGRIVMTEATPEYQYTLKDHLGNTRITFTTKHEVDTFTATLDPDTQQEEQNTFGSYNSYMNQPLDPTPAENPSDQILILNGSTLTGAYNGQVGLTKSFGVVPGDIVSASVNAKYQTSSGAGNLAGFAAALTQAFGLTPGGPPMEGISPFEALNAFGAIIATGGRDGEESLPQGYITILVFDQYHNFVDVAYEQVGTSTNLSISLEIRQAGFAYVFLSNDGATEQQIGFDNYSVTHEHSDVIQQDDYYPFGLTFNSYQRENSTKNRYLYNQGSGEKKFNTERIFDLGLDIDLTKYRAYDPAIGRWWQVDPLADEADFTSLTPYNYSFNNPVRYNDPYGDCPPDDPDCGGGGSSSGSDGPSMASLIDQAAGVFDTIVGFLFGDGNDGSAESAASFGNAMNTAPVLSEQAQEMKSNIEGTLGQVPGLNVALNVMDASQAKTTGETMKHLGKAALNANSIPIASGKPGTAPSLKQQANNIKTNLNGGKNSVTVGTVNKQIRYDLAGKSHGKVDTPHKQVYNKNTVNGQVKSITRDSKNAQPMTQQEIRAIRKFLEKQQNK